MSGVGLKLGLALACGLALSGCVASDTGGAVAEDAVAAGVDESNTVILQAVGDMLPQTHVQTIDWSQPSSLPGFYDVVVDGHFFLVSTDGRYVIRGEAYDRHMDVDIGESVLSGVRKQLLAEQAPAEDRIVFAPKNPKYTVTVLTDISCGYCRRLHSQIAEYNQRGIAIEYVAYPRMGLGSDNDQEMQSIWCATDRRKALTDAKNGKPVEMLSCDNLVETQYLLGQRLGLQGTPMMITESGRVIHGYLPPEMLEERLVALEAEGLKG